MGRSAASQLATVTRRSLQPQSCPPSERRRAGRDPPMKGTQRGRPASDPSAAARAEAEPMERSPASQLATVTSPSLQPPSCPPSERRRAAPIATSAGANPCMMSIDLGGSGAHPWRGCATCAAVFGDLMSNISATRGRQDMRFCVCGNPSEDLSHIASLTIGCCHPYP
jgi:hypothetical protein